MEQNITKRIMRHSQTDLIIDHSLCSSDYLSKQAKQLQRKLRYKSKPHCWCTLCARQDSYRWLKSKYLMILISFLFIPTIKGSQGPKERLGYSLLIFNCWCTLCRQLQMTENVKGRNQYDIDFFLFHVSHLTRRVKVQKRGWATTSDH